MNPWPIIFASLWRFRYTVLAFVFLILAGTALSVAITMQERALKTGSASAAEKFDVVVGPVGSRTDALLTSVYLQPGSSRLLTPERTAELLNDERAQFVSPLAFGDSFRGHPIIGTAAELPEHLSGGAFAEGRGFTERFEAVAGIDVELAIGDIFTPSHGVHAMADEMTAEGHDVEYQIVGRMARTGSPWDRALIVPVEDVWGVHGLETGAETIGGPYTAENVAGIPAAVLKAVSVADAYRFRQEYNTDETMAFFPAEVLIQLYQTLGDVRQVMTLMALVTQGLVMLSVVASVLILFRLFMPQFVTLRAIGAPRLYIFFVAWGFVAILFSAGILLGLGAGYLLAFVLSRIVEAQIGIALTPVLSQTELMLALTLWGLGLVIALLPALRLQSQPLATALKAY
ncbi:ABC transporter permease [Pelagibacterium sp. 26DY04]|uniref:ABC transporter permease n=1 Tax=Pelagibacterium sp. 26DY04 TaxID=2967130 RepID=UPI0028156380|nr:ABC transporter permease [Pelagibacterium sp. 26DY04]WMT87143.1 ABC transporter permease [Pelagibacterium sp. 26DY04]